MRRFDARGDGGIRLHGRDFDDPGTHAPGLLLHHGLASSQHIWDLMLPHLVRRHHVVTFDARGHGGSAKPASGYGFDHVVADSLAVARTTHLRRPLIVGHSWGGMAALELAARHPGRVCGAVLVDGGLASLGSSMDWRTAKERLAPPRLDGMHVDEFLDGIRRWTPVSVTPEIEDLFLSLMRVDSRGRIHRRLSYANHFRILRAIWEQRPAELYARMRVPVLAIAARSSDPDEQPFLEAKRRAAATVRESTRGKDVRIVWMEGVHDLPVQHPEALARKILRFASQVVK